jgi:GrpB-like predicted nucleotidyltransferase (UPF0157 family)
MADDPLDTVLIGGRERRPIVIAAYDPAWPARFEHERVTIAGALGATVIAIEHIGSTSVPGLAAKPIVDVLVTVADVDDEDAYLPALEQAGYGLRVRERGHRMFRTPRRDVHVHVWAATDPEVRRYLLFRDRLRADADDRARYEALKRGLAEREWDEMNDYAQAKSALVEEILARAEEQTVRGAGARRRARRPSST